jgi:hypothetical protein
MNETQRPEKEWIVTEKQMTALRLELPPSIIHDLCSRLHTPVPNLSCLGHYERDPCIIPECPVKVKCREYTGLRKKAGYP